MSDIMKQAQAFADGVAAERERLIALLQADKFEWWHTKELIALIKGKHNA